MLSKKELLIKKNILIIGSSGFVGKYLCKYFSKKDFLAFHINRSKNKNKNSFICDISNFKQLNRLIKSFKIKFDIIINLSGQNTHDQKLLKKTIIQGNKNLIRIFKKSNPKIFYMSSVLVYGNSKRIQSENSKIKPSIGYGKIKLSGENLYKKLYKNYLIVRAANIYDNFFLKKGLLKNIFYSFKKNKKLKVVSLNISRNYIHINDFCFLIYKAVLSKSLKNQLTINIGFENISILKILENIEKKTNFKFSLINPNLSINTNPNINVDTKKMIKLLKYKPKFTLKETIKKYLIKNEN